MKKKIITTLMLLVTGGVTHTFAQKSLSVPLSDQKPLKPVTEQVNKLIPVEYTYDQQTAQLLQLPKGRQMGFIIDDVRKVFPELLVRHDALIRAGKGTMKSVSYETVDMSKLIPILVKAIQEQQKELDELKRKSHPSAAAQTDTATHIESYMEAEGCVFFGPGGIH